MNGKFLHDFITSANSITLILLNLFVGVIFGLLGKYLGVENFDGVPEPIDLKLINFCSVVVGIIAFVTAYIIEFEMQIKEHFSNFSLRFQKIEDGEDSITYLGTTLRIFDDHLSDARKAAVSASSISNTLIFHNAHNSGSIEPALRTYLNKAAQHRNQFISSVVNADRIWVEIFSRNVSRQLDANIRTSRQGKEDFYRPFVMKENFPVVNFIIFDGEKPEVWFGFGFFTDNIDGPIFKSKNEKLINYFRRYFAELQHKCIEWHGVDIESFYGTWITAVYLADELKDCAKVTIQASDSGIRIRGEIYKFNRTNRTFVFQNEFAGRDAKCLLHNESVELKFDITNDANMLRRNRRVECSYSITDVRNTGRFIGIATVHLANPTEIFGRLLTQTASDRVINKSQADTSAFLEQLLHNKNIKENRPLSLDEIFSGSSFA